MFFIRIAGIYIQINNKYDFVYRLCIKCLISETDIPQMTVEISFQELEEEMRETDNKFDFPYIESICVYRRICMLLPQSHSAFLFHSALISYNGKGYAFAAKSGVGKSTHISLWKKVFGNCVEIINGDKPIFKICGDKVFAFGTPWCGKEGWNQNKSVELSGIVFLERTNADEKISIRQISPQESIKFIFNQIFTPHDIDELDALFPLIDKTLLSVPCYNLKCDISEESATITRNTIVKDN